MLAISVIDLFAIQLIGLFTGLLAVTGTIFCQQPTLVYVLGAILEGRTKNI
jgi:hypothetical protein